MAAASGALPRGCSTICLPLGKDAYLALIDSPQLFRSWLDAAFRDHPELFPEAFSQGYTLTDDRVSKKLGLPLRRIRCKASGAAFTVRPSCALPYLAGWTDDVEKALFLRRFGVPFWALAHVFGRGPPTGTAWRSGWDATAWLALRYGAWASPKTWRLTSTTRGATATRCSSPRWGPKAAAWGRPW